MELAREKARKGKRKLSDSYSCSFFCLFNVTITLDSRPLRYCAFLRYCGFLQVPSGALWPVTSAHSWVDQLTTNI